MIAGYYYLGTSKLVCSKRSDSGERCEVKKAMKRRGGLGREVLSERLEQATSKCKSIAFPAYLFLAVAFRSR